MPLPRFRSLDIIPTEHDGKPIFVVVDREGLVEQQMALPPFVFVVASMLDGHNEITDIQALIARNFKGMIVPSSDIEAVLKDLDEHLLLESDRLAARRKEIAESYAKLPSRPAKFAGQSYAPTEKELRDQLTAYYLGKEGAGAPGTRTDAPLRAIIAPHIDFGRGGFCYTHAYRALAERTLADLYVILGVAHVSPPNPFVLSSKSYETPLGTVETDQEFVQGLAKRVGERCFDDEVVHRSEHSGEFQAVFARYALDGTPFKIVPILCSSFEPYCGEESPSTVARIEEFIQALSEQIRTCGKKVCVIAGVDYAHVGPRFGDKVALDETLLDWMVREDEKTLEVVAQGNAEGLWKQVMAEGNKRHICGLTATYATLRLLGGAKGTLLKYGYAPDPAGGIVSFASLAF